MHHRESRIVESLDELPNVSGIENLFLDVETVSGDDSRGALRPYHGDRICGIAFTFDDCRTAWYLPIRHRLVSGSLAFAPLKNLPVEATLAFVQSMIVRPELVWINHNVKFDAHFLACEGVKIRSKMIDTKTLAQVVDMQSELHGYGLKPLSRDWLNLTTDEQEKVKAELRSVGSNDFACVSIDTLGRYACADVHLNRELWNEIVRRRYEGIDRIWSIENDLTNTLFRIETRGMHVDRAKLYAERRDTESRIAEIECDVSDLGYDVNLNSPQSLVEFVTGTLGLPVVVETEKGRPSVNAEAVAAYRDLVNVDADPKIAAFLKCVEEHRDVSQYHALYLVGWEDWIDDRDVIRPIYNQTVRTGRMSCHSPNFQQLDKRAKALIVPAPGNAFLSRDYSQLEYRVIAAICREPKILGAYQADPTTDFHTFVADLCNIDRKPAKSINFGMAFGMGESKLIRVLASLLGGNTESDAKRILSTYHRTFPTIKSIAKLAERRTKSRGWIRTMYGRRRALDAGYEFKAFNTAVQGTAADIVKERLVDLERDAYLARNGVTVRAVVHDEVLLEGPKDVIEDPHVGGYIDDILTAVEVDLGVPFLVTGGTSSESWAGIA